MDIQKQVQQRLESLKAAGVEYMPVPSTPANERRDTQTPGFSDSVSVSPTSHAADSTPVSGTSMLQLEVLAKEIAVCKKCPELFSTRTQTVFGIGKLEPELCFIGEAPGADEDAKGEPFVGRAGQLLDKIIVACGFQRQDVYICNTLKCRPPNNATPTPVQCENCRPFFERQIDLVKPKWICCLGTVAAKNVLQSELGIGRLRGTVHNYRGTPVVCTYHPAYLLRNPSAKGECWSDMKFLLTKMGREIPPVKTV